MKRYCVIIFSTLAIILIALLSQAGISFAKTDINIYPDECLIQFHIKKEFYVPDRKTYDDWITETEDMISSMTNTMNNISLVERLYQHSIGAEAAAARQRNARERLRYYTKKLGNLKRIRRQNPGKTETELNAKIQTWKSEIEAMWNPEPYDYDCCSVKFIFEGRLRNKGVPIGRKGGTPGYDQIAIVAPPPGMFFRSYIKGGRPYNKNGFSKNAYEKDLTGAWTFDTDPGYTAPHEVGHELGVADQYEDVNGVSRSKEHHESDLMGITDLANFTPSVIVRDANGKIRIDNIINILVGSGVKCPPECCGENGVSVGPDDFRGRGIDLAIGSKREPHHEVPRDAVDHRVEDVSSTTESSQDNAIQTATPDDKTQSTQDLTTPLGDTDITSTPDTDTTTTPTETYQDPVTDPAVTQDNATPVKDNVQTNTVKKGGVTCDTTVICEETPTGMDVGVAILPKGKGINFRRWRIENAKIVIGGVVIRAYSEENFYIDRESAFKDAATAMFIAIGSQYERDGGGACPVTGQKTGGERSDFGKSIDKAGMTAGLGMLASQGKGELTGKKYIFRLNKEQAQKVRDGKAQLKIKAENFRSFERETIKTPI